MDDKKGQMPNMLRIAMEFEQQILMTYGLPKDVLAHEAQMQVSNVAASKLAAAEIEDKVEQAKGAMATALTFDKLMEEYILGLFAVALGVPHGQKWAEVRDEYGVTWGYVLFRGQIYKFEINDLWRKWL